VECAPPEPSCSGFRFAPSPPLRFGDGCAALHSAHAFAPSALRALLAKEKESAARILVFIMGALPPYPRPRREAEGQGEKDPLPLCFSGYSFGALSRPSRYAVPLRGSLDSSTGSADGKVFSAHQREGP
jgi:hypothetical protein